MSGFNYALKDGHTEKELHAEWQVVNALVSSIGRNDCF